MPAAVRPKHACGTRHCSGSKAKRPNRLQARPYRRLRSNDETRAGATAHRLLTRLPLWRVPSLTAGHAMRPCAVSPAHRCRPTTGRERHRAAQQRLAGDTGPGHGATARHTRLVIASGESRVRPRAGSSKGSVRVGRARRRRPPFISRGGAAQRCVEPARRPRPA